jgi:CxxC-x17-CxxC domain-containing protein
MAYDDNQGGFQRKMYQGNWKCSKCGKEITELPFDPDPSRLDQLLCRDCHREKRQTFRSREPRRY